MDANHVIVAVYDPTTGRIRQTVECAECDADKQHAAWPGCTFMDVTANAERVHPNVHQIDPITKKVIPIIRTLAEVHGIVIRKLAHACSCERAQDPDLQLLTAEAFLGGQPERTALANAVAVRKARDAKLATLTACITAAKTTEEAAAITWATPV